MHKTVIATIIALFGILPASVAAKPAKEPPKDPRNIRHGSVIPDEGYCDQPYIVITADGNWLCTLTTGKGIEGQPGQHVCATISTDRGKTWSPLIDIEPADGPAASWAMPLVTPSGRVYVFYDYNGEQVTTLGDRRNVRADMLGWYVYKYSDDNGRTWSAKRYRLPVRETEYDRNNDYQGRVQMFWGIGKPIIAGDSVILGFSKIGKYLVEQTEGWFFRSDNLLTEPDPDKHEWVMLPEGDIGLRTPVNGPIAEEQNLVALSDGTLYTMYRTVEGHPCHAYSSDGGKTWTPPAYATYTPGGRLIKHPRACPRLWKLADGRFLFWFHNNGGKDFNGRNPVWLLGGVEKDGKLHWSQPDIVLYDPDPSVRISYPDLVEIDGRYWISETQKEIARIHEIDPALIDGLFAPAEPEHTPLAEATTEQIAAGSMPVPKLPPLRETGGASFELWLDVRDDAAGQALFDSRDATGKGVLLATIDDGAVRVLLCDGRTATAWDSDRNVITPGKSHHVVCTIDGGPRVMSFVVDGLFSDGGDQRPYGWGLLSPELTDINGGKLIRFGESPGFSVRKLAVHGRALRTSEAIGLFRAGPPR